MHYYSHTLPSGFRLMHLPSDSSVSYCGVAIRAGARNESPAETGLAHFVEHLLFKGTQKRRAWHILNRMEVTGGEINAYTSKEETFIYSVFPETDFERAVELMSDMILHSQFPEQEVEKERLVILDEIGAVKDNPPELIADEFEELLFAGHPLGHAILGNKHSLRTFDRQSCFAFVNRHYTAGNMVFFSMGRTDFKRIVRLCTKYFSDVPVQPSACGVGMPPTLPPPCRKVKKKKTHQAHVMIGSHAYAISDSRQSALFLLNNILGGPGMNSRLNVSLRERNGLVYHVESGVTTYTDTGAFSVYFGSDPKHREKAMRLVEKEMRVLREKKLSATQLSAVQKQAVGQIGVSNDNREALFLSMGKMFLHCNRYDSLPETFRKINGITASQLCDVANEVFAPERLFGLIYE